MQSLFKKKKKNGHAEMWHGFLFKNLQVYSDWFGELRIFSLLEKVHDPQQDPVVVWLWVQIFI